MCVWVRQEERKEEDGDMHAWASLTKFYLFHPGLQAQNLSSLFFCHFLQTVL